VSSVASESESCTVSAFPKAVPGTSSAFAEDVPAAAVVVAVVVVVTAAIAAAVDAAGLNAAVANEARRFVLFSHGQASDYAFRLPWLLPDVSVAGFSALPGVILGTISGNDGNAA
jgi:hypothetical protein